MGPPMAASGHLATVLGLIAASGDQLRPGACDQLRPVGATSGKDIGINGGHWRPSAARVLEQMSAMACLRQGKCRHMICRSPATTMGPGKRPNCANVTCQTRNQTNQRYPFSFDIFKWSRVIYILYFNAHIIAMQNNCNEKIIAMQSNC